MGKKEIRSGKIKANDNIILVIKNIDSVAAAIPISIPFQPVPFHGNFLLLLLRCYCLSCRPLTIEKSLRNTEPNRIVLSNDYYLIVIDDTLDFHDPMEWYEIMMMFYDVGHSAVSGQNANGA